MKRNRQEFEDSDIDDYSKADLTPEERLLLESKPSSLSEIEKTNRRKIQNRIAASKSRDNKRSRTDEMESLIVSMLEHMQDRDASAFSHFYEQALKVPKMKIDLRSFSSSSSKTSSVADDSTVNSIDLLSKTNVDELNGSILSTDSKDSLSAHSLGHIGLHRTASTSSIISSTSNTSTRVPSPGSSSPIISSLPMSMTMSHTFAQNPISTGDYLSNMQSPNIQSLLSLMSNNPTLSLSQLNGISTTNPNLSKFLGTVNTQGQGQGQGHGQSQSQPQSQSGSPKMKLQIPQPTTSVLAPSGSTFPKLITTSNFPFMNLNSNNLINPDSNSYSSATSSPSNSHIQKTAPMAATTSVPSIPSVSSLTSLTQFKMLSDFSNLTSFKPMIGSTSVLPPLGTSLSASSSFANPEITTATQTINVNANPIETSSINNVLNTSTGTSSNSKSANILQASITKLSKLSQGHHLSSLSASTDALKNAFKSLPTLSTTSGKQLQLPAFTTETSRMTTF